MREIKDLHQPFIAYLQRWQIPYIYHRPDRRSGITKGHPDFTVLWQGKAFLIEFKVPTGKLSLDQIKRQELLSCSGTHTLTLDSLENAIGYLEAWMGEKRFLEPTANAGEASPKLYVTRSNVGDVVVQKLPTGLVDSGFLDCVRIASQEDLKTLPRLGNF